MKLISIIPMVFFYGCSSLAPIADDIEKIETDNAIKVEIQKEAIQHDTDVNICIDVMNRDELKESNH